MIYGLFQNINNKVMNDILKPYLINFDKLKVDDKLFSMRSGEVTITRIDTNKDNYPIYVEDKFGNTETYMIDGRVYLDDIFPILFTYNPLENLEKSEYPKEMWVSVSEMGFYSKRLVITKLPNCYVTIYNNSNITDNKPLFGTWAYAKDIEKEVIQEFTVEEIAQKLGIDPKLFKIKA